MVQSKAADVETWLAEADPKREPVLRAVRDLAVKHLGAGAERMAYGMPAYQRPEDDAPLFAFNSQKQYISLYVSTRVRPHYEAELEGLDAGKSCIRFRKPEQVDLSLLDRMLADSAKLSAVVHAKPS